MRYLLLALLLTGCEQMTNEEITKQYKLCKDAGMCAAQGDSGYIRCVPCKEKP